MGLAQIIQYLYITGHQIIFQSHRIKQHLQQLAFPVDIKEKALALLGTLTDFRTLCTKSVIARQNERCYFSVTGSFQPETIDLSFFLFMLILWETSEPFVFT